MSQFPYDIMFLGLHTLAKDIEVSIRFLLSHFKETKVSAVWLCMVSGYQNEWHKFTCE